MKFEHVSSMKTVGDAAGCSQLKNCLAFLGSAFDLMTLAVHLCAHVCV